ncbi:MAG: efflux RND transporter periplasmic adaptor subunit [Rhodothermales bacterium]
MTPLRPQWLWTFGILVMVLAAGCGSEADENADQTLGPIALVDVVQATAGSLTERLVTYGTVVAAPGARQAPSVPFEAIVSRVLVTDGMPVTQGQTLVVVRPSPAAQIEIEQARSALQAAEDQLQSAVERDSLGLTTRDQMSQVEQALSDARARYTELTKWNENGRVTAPAEGVVTAVEATEGALLPAGAPLVSLALQGRFEVRLGAEPENIDRIHMNQRVRISRVGEPGVTRAEGRVRSVARSVSPDTRLVDVMVTVAEGKTLLYGEMVQGEIEVQSTRGVIVPRSSVLPNDGVYRLFTIRQGRAFAHSVQIGVETDSLVEVLSGLSPGDSVVVLGNYVLEDSMRVRTNSESATTRTSR